MWRLGKSAVKFRKDLPAAEIAHVFRQTIFGHAADLVRDGRRLSPRPHRLRVANDLDRIAPKDSAINSGVPPSEGRSEAK